MYGGGWHAGHPSCLTTGGENIKEINRVSGGHAELIREQDNHTDPATKRFRVQGTPEQVPSLFSFSSFFFSSFSFPPSNVNAHLSFNTPSISPSHFSYFSAPPPSLAYHSPTCYHATLTSLTTTPAKPPLAHPQRNHHHADPTLHLSHQ